jgi:hypothetical protein
MRRLKVYTQRT